MFFAWSSRLRPCTRQNAAVRLLPVLPTRTPLAERCLWRLQRGDKFADARVRRLPDGLALVLRVSDQATGRRAFTAEQVPALYSEAASRRERLIGLGWTETPRPPPWNHD